MLYKLIYDDGDGFSLVKVIRLEYSQYEILRDFIWQLPKRINITLKEAKDAV